MVFNPLGLDYKDEILAESNTQRKYRQIVNADGTISLQDMTSYSQEGTVYSARDIIEERKAINDIYANRIDDFSELENVSESGHFCDALLVKEMSADIKANKVLWSGSVLLQSSQTVELSEPISEQKNGIVLLFVDYTSSGAGTQGYWDCFIPKQAVADFDGRFWSCSNQRWSVSNATACNVMKCFYVSDTKITGHDYSISNGDGVYGMGSVLCRVYGI